jgi:biotin carboxylase
MTRSLPKQPARQDDAILLIGSGDRLYREYVCAAIARRHRLVLLASTPTTWQRPHLVDSIQVPLDDADAVLAAARHCAIAHRVRGVLTYDETRVLLAAQIAAALGIAHLDPAAAARCRDKLATRRALASAGVPSARAHHVRTLAEARAAGEQVGYPIVLKPRGLAGSIGVTRVDDPDGLEHAFETGEHAHLEGVSPLDGLLVEEYLDGPEVSVDCAVLDGRVEIATIAQKRVGFAPFFEEVGHVVAPLAGSSLPVRRIREVVVAAHRALGVERGMTHTELRLTDYGPRIVEVNARLGGDLIPYVGHLATGVDVAAAAADVAVGRRPRLTPTRSRAAAVRFFYPAADARVLALGIDPDWPLPSWLDRLCWEALPGDVLRLPPEGFLSRLGFAVVTGAGQGECEARLDEVERHLRVATEPLVQPLYTAKIEEVRT